MYDFAEPSTYENFLLMRPDSWNIHIPGAPGKSVSREIPSKRDAWVDLHN